MNSDASFNYWFVVPVQHLRSIPNNDGSFVALAISLFLYERYASVMLKQRGMKVNEKNIPKQIVVDFGIDEHVARAFWDVMRNGLLHQGMPKQAEKGRKTLPDWIFHHNQVEHPMEVIDINGRRLLSVQPWMVVNKVIELWAENLHLLDQNQSFPWAQVYNFKLQLTEKTDGEFYLVTGSSSGLELIGMAQR
jgi:hypothetical protein